MEGISKAALSFVEKIYWKLMTLLDCGYGGTGLFIICGNKYLIPSSCHLNPTMGGKGMGERMSN